MSILEQLEDFKEKIQIGIECNLKEMLSRYIENIDSIKDHDQIRGILRERGFELKYILEGEKEVYQVIYTPMNYVSSYFIVYGFSSSNKMKISSVVHVGKYN